MTLPSRLKPNREPSSASTGSPIVACAAARRIAAWSTAVMMMLINAATSAPARSNPKLRSTTTTCVPKMVSVCLVPANTTPVESALMNDRGTTTIATMSMSFDALTL